MTEAVKQTERELFAQITANTDEWKSIDSLIDLCDRSGLWTEEFLETATGNAKKAHVRRLIKTFRGEDGLPEWASVEVTTPEGKTERRYKQETLFDIGDYKQVVKYHGERASYHTKIAHTYIKRCKSRFNVSPKLDLHY